MLDRRRFVLAVTAALSGLTREARAVTTSAPTSYRWWRQHLSEQAELQRNHWHFLTIVAVHDDGNRLLEQFTVVFQGPVGDPVAESIYDVNVAGASAELVIQPAGTDASGSYCRTTISRLRPWLLRLLLRRRAS